MEAGYLYTLSHIIMHTEPNIVFTLFFLKLSLRLPTCSNLSLVKENNVAKASSLQYQCTGIYICATNSKKKTPRDTLQEKKLLKTHTKKKKLGNTILV
jgi:hypothetical protein